MAEPLSPAAQAVLDAQARQRCLHEWSTVNDPPCHPSDSDWNGCGTCVDRSGVAAALRALADQVVPVEAALQGGVRPGGTGALTPDEIQHYQRTATRRKILAIAAELEGKQ